jgi:hypothetical protein
MTIFVDVAPPIIAAAEKNHIGPSHDHVATVTSAHVTDTSG